MDHAEVRERLAAALLGPGGLSALDDDSSQAGVSVREHLAGCAPCHSEYQALQATNALLANASPDDLRPDETLRARVLGAVHETGRPRRTLPRDGDVPSPARRPLRLVPRFGAILVVAAVVVVAAGGVFLGRDLIAQRDAAASRAAALGAVTTATSRLLAAADHAQATLVDPQGQAAGSVLFDPATRELLVFATSLGAQATATIYDCYLERNGQRTRVGWMYAAGDFAYWDGTLPAGTPLDTGDRFLVLDETPGATPALSGTF
jgi:hypothetical protein